MSDIDKKETSTPDPQSLPFRPILLVVRHPHLGKGLSQNATDA